MSTVLLFPAGRYPRMTDSRIDRERDFHDGRMRQETRTSAWKFYAVTARSVAYFKALLLRECAGKQVLEYGCGTGSYAIDMARAGAHVTAIDISPLTIERAKERAAAEGLSDRITFRVMNAEALEFPPASFDRVVGRGILHHLDLARGLEQIRHVVKPGGDAVFLEPLGHNPLINLYRKMTPRMRSEDEHPLVTADLKLLHQYFDRVEVRYFHVTVLALGLWRGRPGFEIMRKVLDATDTALLSPPFMHRFAWIAVMRMTRKV